MKNIIFILVSFLLGISLSGHLYAQKLSTNPHFNAPKVIIYGRDSCPFTANMKKELSRAKIKYDYKIIDLEEVKQAIYPRMKSRGLPTQHITLPIVEVSDDIVIHPKPTEVIDMYLFAE